MKEIIIAFLLLSGSIFSLVAAIGMLRLPDVLMRMHAAAKAGILGTSLVLLGHAVYFLNIAITLRVLATITFIWLTAPIAVHLVGRAAYCSRVRLSAHTWIDQLSYACGWEEPGEKQTEYNEITKVDPDA